jgi:hypothetical protein
MMFIKADDYKSGPIRAFWMYLCLDDFHISSVKRLGSPWPRELRGRVDDYHQGG